MASVPNPARQLPIAAVLIFEHGSNSTYPVLGFRFTGPDTTQSLDGQGFLTVDTTPATPSNLNIPGQTQGDILFYDGTKWTRLPAGTSGDFLKTLGAGANPTWAAQSTIATDLSIAGQAQGDVLYFTGTVWTRLAAGASGTFLKTQGVGANPVWAAQSTIATDLNIAGQTQGDVLYFNGTVWTRLPAGTSGQFLKTFGAGVNPSWASQSTIATDLSITGQAKGDVLYFNGTVWTKLAAGTNGYVLETQGAGADPAWAAPIATDLSIAGETQGDVLYFNGANWTRLPAGTSGNFLKTQGAGADPTWAAQSTVATNLSITGQAQGDILYFNGTVWTKLAAGTSGQFLKTLGAGANPAWAGALTPDTGRIFLTNMAGVLAPSNVLGNFTTGQVFSVIGSGTIQCTGLKFYWVTTGGAFTIKCSLWSQAGVQMATVNVSVNATGVYTATFAAAQTLTSGEIYTVGVYNATNYTRTTQANINSRYPTRPASVGGLVVVTDIRAFIGGDAKPTNADATEAYIVDPVLTFA